MTTPDMTLQELSKLNVKMSDVSPADKENFQLLQLGAILRIATALETLNETLIRLERMAILGDEL